MEKNFIKKVIVAVLSLLFVFVMIIGISACDNKTKNPSNPGGSENGEMTESEIYENAFDKLSVYIKNNAQVDKIYEEAHGYSYVNGYTDSEDLFRKYSMNFIYLDVFNSDDLINIRWNVEKLALGTDVLSMTISKKMKRSLEIKWTSGLTGNIGIFYIEPQSTYSNTNIMFTDYEFNDDFYEGVVDTESEAAKNMKMSDERNATEELSYFLEAINKVLSNNANVELKNFGFSKIGQKTKYSQVLKIIDIEKEIINLKVGERHTLSYIIYPYFVDGKEELYSSDENIVSVANDGTITAVGTGYATITLKAGTLTNEFHIVVRDKSNVDLAREFFEKNDGQKFDLQGNKISSPHFNSPYYIIQCINLDSGERAYMIKLYSNNRNCTKLDIIDASLSMPLSENAENIKDELLKGLGTFTACKSNGMDDYDTTAMWEFELMSSGEIFNFKFKETYFVSQLSSSEKLEYLSNMTTASNLCLHGLKIILAKNANAYFDINAEPEISISNKETATNSVLFTYDISNYFNEHIISAEIYKDGELIKDCTSAFIKGENIYGLYSNTTYVLKVKYEYNKNDGLGNQIIEKSVTFRTDAVLLPDFDANITTTVSTAEITFVSNNSTPYNVSKIVLYRNGSIDKNLTDNLGEWKFIDLLSDTLYRAEITYTYDLKDGHGLQTNVKTITFNTDKYMDPSVDIIVESSYTSADYEINLSNTADLNFIIIKIELYMGNKLVKELGIADKGTISELFTDNEYCLKITYTYDKNDGKGVQTRIYEGTFETLNYEEPSFQHTADSTCDSITYKISSSAIPEIMYELTKIEVLKGDNLVATSQNSSDTVSNLFSNTDYIINAYYTYDLLNGKGVQNEIYSFIVHTKSYTTPSVDITVNSYSDNDVTFAATLNDPDGKGKITRIELKVNDEVVSSMTEFADFGKLTLNGLNAYDVFDIVVYYNYDLFDGNGQRIETNTISAINTKFIYDKSNDEIKIKGISEQYTGDITTLIVPETIEGISNIIIKSLQSDRQKEVNKLVISNSVTEFYFAALRGYSELQSISLPFIGENLEGSGAKIFGYIFGASGSSSNATYVPQTLREVIITGGTSIGQYAFRDCNMLTSITIPNSTTSIEDNAFFGCSGLTSLTIPDSVTSIGQYAFRDCIGLMSIIMSNSIKEIGYRIFWGCSGLTNITIPDGVMIIESGAFFGCSGLISVTIPDSVTNIGQSAFEGCSKLTSISIPFVGEKIDGKGATNFGYIFGAYNDSYNNQYVPESLKKVIITGGTSIKEKAFYDCNELTNITIPNSVTSIGEESFYGCSGLTSIIIPNGVISIGLSAFKGCDGLTSITVPFVGEKIDGTGSTNFGYIFGIRNSNDYVPKSLREVIITEGTSIGSGAFSGCRGLTSITIPDSVTSIGGSAFRNCTGLTDITIPDGITSIGDYAFSGCTGFTSITIPDSVISIGSGAFSSSNGLTSMTIGKGVTTIGSSAFSGCTGLTIIMVPDSVTNIGSSAFSGCTGLTNITIPNSVTCIGDSAFRGCTGITSITILDSVASIGDYAFSDCKGLTSITIPNSVTSIGEGAFNGCSAITDITLPFVGNHISATYENAVFGYIFGYKRTGASGYYIDDYPYVEDFSKEFTTKSYGVPTNVVNQYNCYDYKGTANIYSCGMWMSVTRYGLSSYNYYIPNTIKKVTITKQTIIPCGAFMNCNFIETIVLPKTTEEINSMAFYNCNATISKDYVAQDAPSCIESKVADKYRSVIVSQED